jgi:hypothetical protein
MDVRFLSPPEIVFFSVVPINVSWHLCSPSSQINFATRLF